MTGAELGSFVDGVTRWQCRSYANEYTICRVALRTGDGDMGQQRSFI